ncbi:synergin gamma-like isoform X2 [Sceloporus undulatus]|uniref:synergin gamma-like isoform X2 n=1 Tax=Sceloporus undulatus TaxID=8520 RepID=UPI001C4C7833|nr:synergin gamma-like isoform X2 [Sceloporus undulatus]
MQSSLRVWAFGIGLNFKSPHSQTFQMNSETVHLMRCLRQAHKVIGKASEILAGVSQQSVCREVLLSGPGTAYILGLSEVYRVSKRLESGMKARKLASELLEHTLHEVDLAWNNLLSFLTFGPSLFQRLDFQIVESFVGSDPLLLAPSHLVPSPLCGVCLTEVKWEPEVHSGNANPVSYQGSSFHASCANFWLNCVDATLPKETGPLFSSEFLNAPQSSILLEGERDCPPEILCPSRSY